MDVHFPFMLDGRGRTADATHADHIRQLIEQVLFTQPGERVNRPDFGCGLLREVFGTPGHEEQVATRFLVQQQLGTWLGDLIDPRRVDLEHRGNRLIVTVEYVDRTRRVAESAVYEVSGS